jgi:tripartite-type tricarboxylate transporter receptor subunit TctC
MNWMLRAIAVAALSNLALAQAVQAQLNPSRAITIVVPLSPGGGVDAIGRLVAEKLQERLKQNVVVENRTGAGGIVGTDSVAKAEPDGHTLLLIENSATISKWLNQETPYDVVRDFAPVAQVATSPLMLFAHPSLGAKDVKDMIGLAKTKQLAVAIPGMGTPHHLAHLMLQSAAKIDIQVIPYRGTGPGLVDLLAGRVPLMWATPVALIPHVEAGKVNALGVASLKRAASLPQAPTIAENVLPGFNAEIWFGVAAPAKTPRAIVAHFAKEIAAIVELPDVKERTKKLGFELAYAGSDEFRKVVASDHERFGKAIAAAGIAPK